MKWWIILIIVFVVLLFLCFLLSIANFSGERFQEKYQEMNKRMPSSKITPIEFISNLNYKFFQGKLQIVQISSLGKDAYSNGKIFLSTDTLRMPSLASYSIIAHEMGHAKQDIEGKKLKVLKTLRRLGRILGLLMTPSIVSGLILMIIGNNLLPWGIALASFGVLIFFLAVFIKIRTISIEKEASKNAVDFLEEYFSETEVKYCKDFMKDAGLTYWADFLRTCLWWTAMSRKTKLFH